MQKLDDTARGLLLVGHGSQEQQGVDEFLTTARMVSELAGALPVEPCFLEFAEPTIAQGFRALVERGVRQVVVVPVLLFSAGHDQRDIPAEIERVAAEFPGVSYQQVAHLGCHESLVELSGLRYEQALSGLPNVAAEQTALVMVGRGSRDLEAQEEMRRFAALCGQLTPVSRVEVAFVAMAEPSLDDVLEAISRAPLRRVVVQPHLLFGGVLVERIGGIVGRHAETHTQIEWVVTSHLGAAPLTAAAIFARASTACFR